MALVHPAARTARPALTPTERPTAAARSPRPRRRPGRPAAPPLPARPSRARPRWHGDTTVGALDAERAGGRRRTCCRRSMPTRERGQPLRPAVARRPTPRARRLPLGPRAGPPQRCGRSCSRRRTRSTTRSRAASTPELAEELGDLLLQIVLHAQYAAEAGVFDLADVQRVDHDQDRPPPPPRLRGRARRAPRATSCATGSSIKAGERAAARASGGGRGERAATRTCPPRSRASRGRCRRSRTPTRCRSARPASATTGPTSRASSTRSPRRRSSCCGRPTTRERRRGVRRPAVRARQPRPQAGHRPGGRAAGGQPQVRVALRARGAARR